MGAPLGNKNAARPRIWRDAIERALERRSLSRVDGKKEIDALAEELLKLVAAGDLNALKEFGDRIDGKPAQIIAGDPENPAPLGEILIRSVGVTDRPTAEGS